MQKPFNYKLFAIVALAIPFAFASAETTPPIALVTKTLEKTSISSTPPVTDTAPNTDAIKKDGVSENVETKTGTPVESPSDPVAKTHSDLRTMYTQFNLFAARIQITIDRLAAKKIDTKKAQVALDASEASLLLIKNDLDLIADIKKTPDGISDKNADQKIQQDTLSIKPSIKKIEDTFKDARARLIESLLALKASIALSIDPQG